jgi:hypothetical protein
MLRPDGIEEQDMRNVDLELLDRVLFKDAVYTGGQTLVGYITKVEPDIKKGEIKLGVIFEPDDFSDLIIERGRPLNDSMLIEESGNRENTIIERGNVS